MGFTVRKLVTSVLLAIVLLPAVAFANTEFKGTETVNINRADAATLAAYLKGVGVNKAEAIVKYRKANGKFKTLEDLKNVPGIGDETVKDNKRKLSTSRGKTSAPEGYKLGQSSGKSKKTTKKSATKKSTKKSSSSSKDDTTASKKKKSSSKSSDKKMSTKDTKKKSSKSSDTKKKSSKSTKDKKKPKKKTTTKKAKKSKDTTKKKTKKKEK